MLEEKSAGVIIFRREEKGIVFLLLHYQSGHWDFAKGNIEKNEGLTDTVIREVKEETGIEEIEFVGGFKEEINYYYKLKGKNIFKSVVFFLAETKIKEIKISFEHIGFQWLPYEQALARITFKDSQNLLKKANDLLKN